MTVVVIKHPATVVRNDSYDVPNVGMYFAPKNNSIL